MAKFDLTVFMAETERAVGRLRVQHGSVRRGTIERMVGHFQTLLEGIVADPARRVSELPLLGEEERERVVVEWNRTEREYPGEEGLVELFEAQAERRPEAVAVVYRRPAPDLRGAGRRANQLAQHLRRRGWGRTIWWGSAWSGRWRWWWGCWGS